MPGGRGVSPAARLSFPEGAGRRLAEEEGSRRSLEESLAFLLRVPAQSDAGVCLFENTQITLRWWSGWRQEARLLGQGLNQTAGWSRRGVDSF